MPRRTLVFLTLLSLFVLVTAGVAQANAGPPRVGGDKNGVILPGTSAQVHVKREVLRFDLSQNNYGAATVTASYELENRGPALKEFPVIFVWQAAGQHDASVLWNGKPVPARAPDLGGLSPEQLKAMEQAWGAMDTAVDPVTGAEYREDYEHWNAKVGYLQFVLNLEAGAAGTLEVQYQHTAARDNTRHAHPTYIYQYLLVPARNWASFGPLEIRVKAPDPKQAFFAANLPLKWEGGEYRATLPGLPEQNLAFALTSRAGLVGKLTSTGPYFVVCFLLVMAGAVMAGVWLGRISGRIRHRGWAIAAGVASGLLAGGLIDLALAFGVPQLFTALSDSGYGWAFLALATSLLAVPVTTVVSGVITARTNRSRYGGAAA